MLLIDTFRQLNLLGISANSYCVGARIGNSGTLIVGMRGNRSQHGDADMLGRSLTTGPVVAMVQVFRCPDWHVSPARRDAADRYEAVLEVVI